MKKHVLLLLAAILSFFNSAFSQKTVFTPTEWNDPNNEYYGRMSSDRQYESENFALFWGDIVGTNPATYNGDLKFDPVAVADTLETSFSRMIDDLHFINNSPTTNFGKYKTIVVILGTFSGGDERTTGFAHASSYSNTIGALFVHPAAVKDGGALSHEYAHTLQMMMRIQENPGNGTAFAGYDWAGPFFEGHANYMRAMVYPKWADTESTLTRWLQTRHFMWSSSRHHYTNYHVLFYILEKDGFDLTRRLWAESANQEHPFETLRRLKGFTQEQLNDYLYGNAARQVAFDYPVQWDGTINRNNNMGKVIRSTWQGIKSRIPRYTSRQYTLLDQVEGSTDRYYVNEDWAPQDYGMNIIPLYPTCPGTNKSVTIKFKGHTEVNPDFAGWRYGFVTTKPDGTVSRYSPMYSQTDGEATFSLNTNTESNIFLVVSSAPKKHQNYNMDVGYPKQRRYPYELKIANAVPEGYQPSADFRSWMKTNGHTHPNGGGWVSNSATVASGVYVGPYALVRSGNISGNVRIEDHAIVENANISNNVIVRDNACIYGGTYSGNAIIEGNAWLEGCSAGENATIQGNAFLFAATFNGTVVVGGDAEIGSCNNGVYLQFPYWRNGRENCDGKDANDVSNVDINPAFTLFTGNQMDFQTLITCDGSTYDCANVKDGSATLDVCGKCIGGTTGVTSDDSDADGVLDCKDACPDDPAKVAAGFCGCGVEEGTCGIEADTLVYTIQMPPMADYTPITISLDANRIAKALNLTKQEVISTLGTSIIYNAVNPDGTLDPNSTASAPGHWFNQAGQTVVWGTDAYIYSELNMNNFSVNIGQYPDRSHTGDTYTIKQALVYQPDNSEPLQAILIFNLEIVDVITYITSGTVNKLKGFPNPTTGKVNLSETTSWQLYNPLGLMIDVGTSSGIDLSDLPAGIYFIKSESGIIQVVKE